MERPAVDSADIARLASRIGDLGMSRWRRPGDDAGATDARVHRAALGYDALENRALDLARLVLDMHRGGAAAPWLRAVELAEGSVGPFEGPYLVARVTSLVRALLAERDRPFAYLSAGSMYVSDDEAELMSVVRLARSGPFAEFKDATQALTGRDHVCRMLAAATALVRPDEIRREAARSTFPPHDGEGSDPPPSLH